MKTAKRVLISIILNGIIGYSLVAQLRPASTVWFLDRTDSIGGCTATGLRKLPAIIETAYGKAALFSCYDSTALLVSGNPIGSDTAFTIEVYFRPDSTILAGKNNEQRFIHINNFSNDNRRVLLEIRQLQNYQWLLDTYIKSESSNLTLIDSTKSHSSGEWHHVAMTYSNGMMRQFVDGIEQLSGPVQYLPIDANGKTSIGARQDPRSWFNGAIRMIKVTKSALPPEKFTIPLVTRIDYGHTIPDNIQLHQNFPNPFNPTTVIRYQLSAISDVTLNIYDLWGRETATLVSDQQRPGVYQAAFDARKFASGIYFYRLTAGNFSEVKKMVLIK